MKVQSRSNSKKIGELVCDGAMKFVDNFAVEINGERVAEYESLDAVAKDWEDYKPAEPYIEDKKVRKFVRDWAEHWKIDKVIIRFIDSNRIDLIGFPSSNKTGREIDIQRTVVRNEIIYGNRYTINELCGEEG